MNEKEQSKWFTRILIGVWMAAVIVLQGATVFLLADLRSREPFVWHDESLVEALARLDGNVMDLKEAATVTSTPRGIQVVPGNPTPVSRPLLNRLNE